MKSKILTIGKAIKVAEILHNEGKKVVLAGGCFDFLHIGHISFLEEAKRQGNALFIMLEHDLTIRRLKGKNRPIHIQHDRAKILSSISFVDYVILLPEMTSNKVYDRLVKSLKPAIIATTRGDINRSHKERQANTVGAQVVDVIDLLKDQSTTRLVNLIEKRVKI